MNRNLFAALMLIAALLCPQLVHAQGVGPVFDSGQSDSSLFSAVLNLPADQTNFSGQISLPSPALTRQVNVLPGGTIGGDGGDITTAIGEGIEINVNGGSIGNNFGALFGVEVNISSGTIGDNFQLLFSEVNISGGSIGSNFQTPYSQINIFGSGFLLDDVPLSLIPDQAFTVDQFNGSILSATLLDGSPFNFNLFEAGGVVTVTQTVPEPTSIIPLIATLGGFLTRRRRVAVAVAA